MNTFVEQFLSHPSWVLGVAAVVILLVIYSAWRGHQETERIRRRGRRR